MKHPTIPLAQTLVQLCKAKKIKHIVISPGSRNAPLTIGFSYDDFFSCYSVVDERCAGFFALGMAQQLQEPVALVCTSGSALLNYYPSVAEAFYSDIPLIVMSADRPEYLVGIGDGQTINQKNVFENHILKSVNLKQDLKLEDDVKNELPIIKSLENKLEKFLGLQKSIQEENEEHINTAINVARTKKGPVHINIPFSEPLYDRQDSLTINPKVVKPVIKNPEICPEGYKEMLDIWNSIPKKMILVGVNYPDKIAQEWLDILANLEDVIVFTETTSNLHHDAFFPSIDKIIAPLNEQDFKRLQPDILLTFGGMVVSKKVKAFLRNFKPKHHWHVDNKRANDTFFSLSKHLEIEPNTFFSQFLPSIEGKASDYKSYWNRINKVRREQHAEYLNKIEFSDLSVFDTVLKSIPDHLNLHAGNSSAIRYLQLFDMNKTLRVFCNRGTSGIDGCTSTAIGFASVAKQPTVLITGDLSFLYDSNALWNNHIPNNFRVIVVNNGGGGIFRILPGPKNTKNFDTFFETKHDLTAEHLCNMYHINYVAASNESELNAALQNFYQESNQPKLLEIFTPSTLNDEILLNYFQYIK